MLRTLLSRSPIISSTLSQNISRVSYCTADKFKKKETAEEARAVRQHEMELIQRLKDQVKQMEKEKEYTTKKKPTEPVNEEHEPVKLENETLEAKVKALEAELELLNSQLKSNKKE